MRIGFAAETEDLLDNAAAKLTAKRLDMIVANAVGGMDCPFGSDDNRCTLIGSDTEPETVPRMSKRELADRILDRVVALRNKA